MRALFFSVVLLLAAPSMAQDVREEPLDGNREMAEILAADQRARSGILSSDIQQTDAERRQRTRELLDRGELITGRDFYAAAFVFQHGDKPDDYLLAHVLAIRALGLGLADAEWIAAATLDRYLQSIERGQVYGTQTSWKSGEDVTMQPYDRELVPEHVRIAAGTGSDEDQAARSERLRERITKMHEHQE